MKKKNSLLGGIFGFLLDMMIAAKYGLNTGGEYTKIGMAKGGMVYSIDMEKEADYVGLYILALSGYDIEEVPNVFRKLGAAHPKNIEAKYATSHPSTPERFIAMEKTVEEIKEKMEKGLPLLPEEKQ